MTKLECVQLETNMDKEKIINDFCPNDFGLRDACKSIGGCNCDDCWNMELENNNSVHKPAHYCYSKYEPKDVIRAWGLNFNLGSAVKYIARAGRKDDIVQDLKKAQECIRFEIDAIEEERAGMNERIC